MKTHLSKWTENKPKLRAKHATLCVASLSKQNCYYCKERAAASCSNVNVDDDDGNDDNL